MGKHQEDMAEIWATLHEMIESNATSSEIAAEMAENNVEIAELVKYLSDSNANNIARIMKLEKQVELLTKFQLMLLQALKEKFGVHVPVEIDNVLKVVK